MFEIIIRGGEHSFTTGKRYDGEDRRRGDPEGGLIPLGPREVRGITHIGGDDSRDYQPRESLPMADANA